MPTGRNDRTEAGAWGGGGELVRAVGKVVVDGLTAGGTTGRERLLRFSRSRAKTSPAR